MNHNCQFSKKLTVKTFIFAVGCLVLFVIALPTDGTSFAGESPEIPKLSSNTEEVSYGSDTWKLDGRAALGTTVALTEQYLKHSLTSLRLIAQSPATRSGIWPQIRPGLAALKEAIPGAALYIEPDGNYYSVEKGYTRLNLSDREYFGPLFRGEEVQDHLSTAALPGNNLSLWLFRSLKKKRLQEQWLCRYSWTTFSNSFPMH